MKKLVILAFFVASLVPFFASQASAAQNQNQKVTICHSTQPNPSNGQGGGPQNNPYVTETVDLDAVDGNANNQNGNQPDHFANHNGPLFNNSGQDYWGDIIPPTTAQPNGLNWTAEGKAIYDNDCKYVALVPVYSCDLLDVSKVGTATYKFDVTYSASNGATFKNVTYDFGDNSQTVTTADVTYQHEYTMTGEYTVQATVNFTANGQVVSDTCIAKVTVNGGKGADTPVTTVTPQDPQVQAPQAGVHAGAGAVIAPLAGLVASVGSLGYGAYSLRKQRS